MCPWPREGLFSEGLSLALTSDFFVSLASRRSVFGRAVIGLDLGLFCVLGLGLKPCVLDSTSDYRPTKLNFKLRTVSVLSRLVGCDYVL